MNRNTYLQTLTDTFFETLYPIESEKNEPLLAFRKKLFLAELTRKQKIFQRDFFVTIKDFELQCCLAIDELKEKILETGIRYANVWSDKNIYLNHDYNWVRNGHNYKLAQFEEVLKMEVEVEHENDLYVNLNSLYPYLKGSVCGWDIEFIEWVLEDINLEAKKQPEPEPRDLSETSTVGEKIITPQTTKQTKNKSLMYEGSNLNLSERFKIANEVLGIDNKIRTLNIPDLKKYQLLAHILGCDKDNARNLMNGTYNSKDRDLTNYFNDLNLNK
jgi:hypothetical protein